MPEPGSTGPPRPTHAPIASPTTESTDAGDAVWGAIGRADLDHRIVVTGMRRSGNHAVINWLANSIEGEQVEFAYPPPGRIGVTPSGRVAHINDLPLRRDGDHHFDAAAARIDLLRGASSIVLSLEDHRIGESFERRLALPEGTRRVHVRRSTLNLLASRIEGLRRAEHRGNSRSGLEITQHLLDSMQHNRTSLPDAWTVIDFDRWLTEGTAHRGAVLADLDLTVDIDPAMSLHGDGSSFTARNRVPTPEELTSRWAAIEWPNRIVELLLRPRNFGLLNETEVEFLLEVPTVD